jgi:tetratricopeptide (TPR) repeat protein
MFVGVILRDLGKDAEAAEAFRAVLMHDPQAETLQTPAAEFYLQFGQTLLRLGKPEEALDPLKRSAAARETPEVLYELGNAALHLQRPADAQTAWQRAVAVDERHAPSREALARAALEQSQPQQALDWLSPLPAAGSTLESAYLRQRAYTLLGNDNEAQAWQQRAGELRKQQEFTAEIDHLLLDSPDSFWARAVRAHRFAQQGNWRQAELLAEVLLLEAPAEPFVIELTTAIHRRRDLPSLDSLPITHF